MGMTRHDALAALAGQLNCRIAEFGEAEFRWRGRNCYSFNRIFLVTAGTGELVNHTGNQRFTLEAGYWYFMPTGLDLEFDFGPQLAFYSLHFQLELLAGCDVFGESRRCSRHRLDEELQRRCREAAAPAGSWRELFRLKALIFELAGELTEHLPEELERHLAVRRRYGVLLDYMARTLSARTRLDELAGVACRSRDRLSREFSRDFGVPLKEFIGRELGGAPNLNCSPVVGASRRLRTGWALRMNFIFRVFSGGGPAILRASSAGSGQAADQKFDKGRELHYIADVALKRFTKQENYHEDSDDPRPRRPDPAAVCRSPPPSGWMSMRPNS